ncbi:zinc finger protein 91-like [Ylistrum balloti]|uniref:zinc finger protein 91-like n=1 Tax=Ylistrum balloti TaxID=509963 RepID=UPI0029059063|nr:zinc finger protein 91-like [Ylistrum balloti]
MDVSGINTDLHSIDVPDSSISTDIWTSLMEMLAATGKEFVVLTAEKKCREGATFGSTLGTMFLDGNSEILTNFIDFCAENYNLADRVKVSDDTYNTENKYLDKVDNEDHYHNSDPVVKHLNDKDFKPGDDNDLDKTSEELPTGRIPDNKTEIAGDVVVSLNLNNSPVGDVKVGSKSDEENQLDEKGKQNINTTKDNKRKSESEKPSKVKSNKVQNGRRTEKQKEACDKTKKVDNGDETGNNIRRSRRIAGAKNPKVGNRTRHAGRHSRKRVVPDRSCLDIDSVEDGENIKDGDDTCIECPACGNFSTNQDSFVKHVLSDHQLENKSRSNSKKISWTMDSKKCPVCGQFAESEGVNSHIFVHCFDVLKYPCNRCPLVFLKMNKLIEHQKKNHKSVGMDATESNSDNKEETMSDQFNSQDGDLKFTSQVQLQKGKLTHGNNKSGKLDLECQVCFLHFKTQVSYQRHMKSHMDVDGNISKCTVCEVTFSKTEDLQKHMLSHQADDNKQYKCEICEKLFKSRSGRRMHKIFSHGDKGLSKYGKNKFECRFCGGVLGTYHTLMRHEARHEQDNESQIQKMGSLMEMATCKSVSVEELRVKETSSLTETDKDDVFKIASSETDTGSKVESVSEPNNGSNENSFNAKNIEEETSSELSNRNCEDTVAADDEETDQVNSDEKKKRKFECKVCKLDFKSQQFLKEHKKIHAISGKSPYACDLCGKIFLRSLSLYKHRQLHDTSGKFTCKTCLKQFNSIESLRRHAKNHLDVKPYICTVCGKGCTEKRNLDTHMLVHTQRKEFICEVCGKAYRTQQQLKEHRYIHTGERPHKCKVCEMAFRSQDVLRNHMALHSEFKKFMCHTCGKTFRQQSCLITHQHTHSSEPTHVCNVCGQGCKSSGALNSHYVSFHLKPEDVASYKWSVHVCEVCNKMFGEKQDHERHMRTHTGEKPYSCEICEKTFADKSNLRSHIRNHNGDRSKKCQICGKGFMFNRDLKKHMVSHNNKARVPMLDNVTVQTALQDSIVPAVDNIVTVITQTDTLPPVTHNQLVPPVSESYEMVTTSLPLDSNLTANLPPMNTENISAVSLMQEATMVHMGVYSNTGDLTWHSL